MNKKQKQILVENLQEFGLSADEATIYIELTRRGPSTSYGLHMSTGTGRSVVDKILMSLVDRNLVSLEETSKSKIFTAFPYKNLSSLVEVKEVEVESMKNSLNKVYEKFSEFTNSTTSGDSKVLHYYGIGGLKQMVWNTLRAKEKMRIFEVSRLSAFMQKSFAERYRKEATLRGIKHYDLTNESHMPGWTDVQEYVDKYQKLRFIDPEVLEIKFEIYIYNDVVTMIDYKNNELLGIEVYNKHLAMLQMQLFDYVWNDAEVMVVTGPRGEMSVK